MQESVLNSATEVRGKMLQDSVPSTLWLENIYCYSTLFSYVLSFLQVMHNHYYGRAMHIFSVSASKLLHSISDEVIAFISQKCETKTSGEELSIHTTSMQ